MIIWLVSSADLEWIVVKSFIHVLTTWIYQIWLWRRAEGSLKVEIQSVEVFSTHCDHEGFPLYVEITISDQLTTSSGT